MRDAVVGAGNDKAAASGSHAFRPAAAQSVTEHDNVGIGLRLDAVDCRLQPGPKHVGLVVQPLFEDLDARDVGQSVDEMRDLDFQNRAGDDRNAWPGIGCSMRHGSPTGSPDAKTPQAENLHPGFLFALRKTRVICARRCQVGKSFETGRASPEADRGSRFAGC